VTPDFELQSGFSAGFLSVLTSFPDIGESASNLVVQTNSYHVGACYCFFGMAAGCLVYSRRYSTFFTLKTMQACWEVFAKIVLALTLLVLAFYNSVSYSYGALPAIDG